MVVGVVFLESVQVSLYVVPWYLRKLAGSVLVVRVGYSNKCPESFLRGPSFAFGLAACAEEAALPAVL